MTTTIVYAATTDRYVTSYGATHHDAQLGSGTFFASDPASDHVLFGQQIVAGEYGTTQGFIRWTYSIPAGEAVTAAGFRLHHTQNDNASLARDLEIREFDWGAAVETADFRPRPMLPGLPLLARVSSVQSSTGKTSFSGSATLAARLDAGVTTLSAVLVSSRHRAGVAPTGLEQSYLASADVTGTTNDPAFVLTSVARSTLHGVLGGAVRLADGSSVVLVTDGTAAPVVSLRRVVGTTPTTIGTPSSHGVLAAPRGGQSYALVADASENLYVVGPASNGTDLAVIPYARSAGPTWTVGTPRTLPVTFYSAPINGVAAAWHATGGAGSLAVLIGHMPGDAVPGTATPELELRVLDVADLLSGAASTVATVAVGGVVLPAESPPSGYHNGYADSVGSGFDLVASSPTAGYVVAPGKSSILGQSRPIGFGRYVIDVAAGTVTGSHGTSGGLWSSKDAGAKARVVPISDSVVVVVTADVTTGWGLTIQPFQITGSTWTPLATWTQLGSESVTGMPLSALLATSGAWDAVHVPSDGKVWIYFPDTTDPRVIRRTGYSLTTYQATRESVVVATVGAAGGTNLAVRAVRSSPVYGAALLSVAHKASGGALSTVYVSDQYSTPPTEPTLTPRANYDATTAATFAWTFNDPNPSDSQTAYQLQIINAATSAVALDTGKVASTATSRSVAGGTLVNGVAYQWRVKTWDLGDLESPWSPYGTFSTGAGGSVTVTAPAGDNPPNATTDDYLIAWTATGTIQTAYRVVVARVDTGVTHSDTGWVTSVATSHAISGLLSGVQYEVRVTVRNASAVESATGTRRITPDYATPDAPEVTLTPNMSGGYVEVSVSNPGPTGDRPAVIRNEVYRRAVGETDWVLIGETGAGGQFRDYTVPAGVPHEYRARGVA